MNKQDMMKVQTCVLRVNIHFDGCKKNVKKLLQNIEGVYTTTIDAEQGKVMVTGAVDPHKLIKKLEKSGKHAELWGGAAPKNMDAFNLNNFNAQFKNLGLEQLKFGKVDNKKSANGGKDEAKKQQQQQLLKGSSKDTKPSKEHKTVKFNLPADNEFDGSGDDFDDEFSDGDDESDGLGDMFADGFGDGHHTKRSAGGKGAKGASKDKKSGGDGSKKSRVFDIPSFMKGLGLKSGDSKKNGDGAKKNDDGFGKIKGGGDDKYGDKHGGNSKTVKNNKNVIDGAAKNKGGINSGKFNGGNNSNNSGGKKGGAKNSNNYHDGAGHLANVNTKLGFNEVDRMAKLKSIGDGGGGGYMGQMGSFPTAHMGNFPAVQGLPAMNGGGYYQNPYQPPHMGMNTMMNQQQYGHGNEMFQPMMYPRQHQPLGYVPPMPAPVSDPYVNMFSDENASGCSVM